MPVSGASPSTAARFTAACPLTSAVMPAATSFPNGSRQRRATVKPANANAANAPMTNNEPISPSSSPMMARIMSVCASGR